MHLARLVFCRPLDLDRLTFWSLMLMQTVRRTDCSPLRLSAESVGGAAFRKWSRKIIVELKQIARFIHLVLLCKGC